MLDAALLTTTPPVAAQELYIVTDRDDKELMFMPLPAILRQNLFCRVAALALLDRHNKLVVYRRPPGLPVSGKWDLFVSPVLAAESRLDTAHRLLLRETGILQNLKLIERGSWRATAELPIHLTLFTVRPPEGYIALTSQRPGFMLLDRDELDGLVQSEPDMFTPTLLKLHSENALFPA